jgi:hypothetical protein
MGALQHEIGGPILPQFKPYARSAEYKSDVELEASFKTWPRERSALYEPALRQWQEDMAEFDAKRTDPEQVAEVIFKALCAEKPKRRYSIGHMARAAAFLESLPQPVVDAILAKRFEAQ